MTAKTTPTLTLEFAYPVRYLPRTCTEHRTAYFMSETDLSFKVVDDADAPVAFRLKCRDKNSYGRQPFAPLPDGSPREVRWHGNGFWLEWGDVDAMTALLTDKKPVEQSPFGETFITRPFEPVTEQARNTSRTKEKSPRGIQNLASIRMQEGTIKQISDDGGVEHAEKIRQVADACIVIDGRVFESIPEPCLTVSESWGDISITCAPDANRKLNFGTLHYGTRAFRLDAFAEAKAMADAAQFNRKGPPPSIEILRPDLVMVDPDGGTCLKAARGLLKDISDVALRLPVTWIGKASAFGLSLEGAPRLPTPALADTLEAIASAPLPDEAQVAYAQRVHDRRGRGGDRGKSVYESLPEFAQRAQALASQARELSERYDTLPGRLDPSVVTRFDVGALTGQGRLRQARAPEDIRRAASLLGEDFESFRARLSEDADQDVVMHEGGFDLRPGKDCALRGVHVVDLATGLVVESAGDEIGQDTLSGHLDRSWPGARPTPSQAPGAGL